MTNLEKLVYLVGSLFKVHLWNADTEDERYAQNNFIGRIAAAILDREVEIGGGQKTTLRTVLRWMAADFADVKARLDALHALLVQLLQSTGGTSLTKEEQAAIYTQAVKDSLGSYEVRRVEAPEEIPFEARTVTPVITTPEKD